MFYIVTQLWWRQYVKFVKSQLYDDFNTQNIVVCMLKMACRDIINCRHVVKKICFVSEQSQTFPGV